MASRRAVLAKERRWKEMEPLTKGGLEGGVGDAEGCPGSWLGAELTDPAVVWSSRTRGSQHSLLPGGHVHGVQGRSCAPSSVLALLQSLLTSGERPCCSSGTLVDHV